MALVTTLSFDANGEPVFIEVKTTRGPADTEFYMSANELEAAKSRGDRYALYRVYNFDATGGSGAFFVLSGPVEEKLSAKPGQYRVRLA